MTSNIRWQQRLENFERASMLLREPLDRGVETLSRLEKEGMVQRFEVALELGWKTLKDYLEYTGIVISPVTPRTVIKEANAAQVLPDAQVWIDMLDHRNVLSHTYDAVAFDKAVEAIRDRYQPAIECLAEWLLGQRNQT